VPTDPTTTAPVPTATEQALMKSLPAPLLLAATAVIQALGRYE
jgi:hypothetical protein